MPHTNFITVGFNIMVIFASVEFFVYDASQAKLQYNYTLKNLIPGEQYTIYIHASSGYIANYWHMGPRFRLRKFSLASCTNSIVWLICCSI